MAASYFGSDVFMVALRSTGVLVFIGLIAACGETAEMSPDGGGDVPCESGGGDLELGLPDKSAVEGGDVATYRVQLSAPPCADVVVEPKADSDLIFSPRRLTFTAETFGLAQKISVEAVHDFEIEGPEVVAVDHVVRSADRSFDGISAAPVAISVVDDAWIDRVSVGIDGGSADGPASSASISDDGRYVAFGSYAGNLVTGDANSFHDVFLRDMDTGQTTRMSVGVNGVDSDGESHNPVLAANGTHVAFMSTASNLTSGPVSTKGEIYRYSIGDGELEVVSGTCTSCSEELSSALAISSSGDVVAYTTRRTLVGDTDSEYDVFVYDAAQGTTTQASLSSSGGNGITFWGSNAFSPTLSANGRWVGFRSAARGFGEPDITVQNFHAYAKSLDSSTLTRVSSHSGSTEPCEGDHQATASLSPIMTSDGALAAFTSACAIQLPGDAVDDNDVRDVFVHDMTSMVTERVSVGSKGEQADGPSRLVGVSDDGRYVVFISSATNLVPNDTNEVDDLFVHDREMGQTRRISAAPDGTQLTYAVSSASVSRSGAYAVFVTRDDLVPGDTNSALDVYRVRLR